MAKQRDKQAEIDWYEFVANMNRSAPVERNETPAQQRKRIEKLEAKPEEWFKYYFSTYYTSEPAGFHKRSTRRILRNPEWYEVRAWSRELSKSGRTMMEGIYLAMTGKKFNFVLTSNSKDNAERLLRPWKVILETNERLIHDYGKQVKHGSWTDSEFITRKGVAFRAVGKGQSPRGTRNDAKRPDVLIVDDFDTDEECRNPDTVDKGWDWLERAFYATRSISEPLLVIFCGNIIAEYCTIKLAMERADYAQVINIRDANGKSTWPQKNTEEAIDRVLSKISYNAAQGEYFNNPITKGKVFDKLHYKRTEQLSRYRFLVAYTDPSYKSGKKNDYKATVLVGRYKDEYHVLKVFCEQTTTAQMLDWQYEIIKYVNGRVPVFFYIEWPSIDDTLKIEIEKANKRHGQTLPLKPDERTKPDKFFRIEALLEPLNRNEKLWFDDRLKVSDHMKNMEAQFLALSPTSRAHDDGPDAVEGAVYIVNSKTSADAGKVETSAGRRRKTSKYY
ncbi:hypothetical protein Q4603_05720 [Zobellia galactanivorans]|uniref:phage terminase large subunit family protein n=1 Tax=Zobellia galactanivorans (strain DSM 12802 / CCUG 47099 / CIP 106680 / NCIMB 13871 / Dsij) TaxID=63186 RepID=UPI0026E2FC15|nr:hypothetical protein [Zobellia galactanivorans]MDO6808093.1 hypothetical protein [Zobellia galactanivorans]